MAVTTGDRPISADAERRAAEWLDSVLERRTTKSHPIGTRLWSLPSDETLMTLKAIIDERRTGSVWNAGLHPTAPEEAAAVQWLVCVAEGDREGLTINATTARHAAVIRRLLALTPDREERSAAGLRAWGDQCEAAEDEANVRAWIAGDMARDYPHWAPILQRMLAEPRMPRQMTEEIKALVRGRLLDAGWAAVREHLMKPKTKTVWNVSWSSRTTDMGGVDRDLDLAAALAAVQRRASAGAEVSLSPREVPA